MHPHVTSPTSDHYLAAQRDASIPFRTGPGDRKYHVVTNMGDTQVAACDSTLVLFEREGRPAAKVPEAEQCQRRACQKRFEQATAPMASYPVDPDEYKVQRGDRWEKDGPAGTYLVRRVMLPGYPHYDGAMPGVSVAARNYDDGELRWKSWFIPCQSSSEFARLLQKQGAALTARRIHPYSS